MKEKRYQKAIKKYQSLILGNVGVDVKTHKDGTLMYQSLILGNVAEDFMKMIWALKEGINP